MDEILAATLGRAVYERLDYLDVLVQNADPQSLSWLASTEIGRLAGTLRDILNEHSADKNGKCRQCSSWFRYRSHPCPVWTIAHRDLIAATASSTAETRQRARKSAWTPDCTARLPWIG